MTAEFTPPPGKGVDLQQKWEATAEPFWFRWGDRWWRLPHLSMLDFSVQARVESFHETIENVTDVEVVTDRVNTLFRLIMGEEQGGAFAHVDRPLNVLLDILNQWITHSGAEPGESAASTGSSTSTERPSKPTSTATTASGSRKRSTGRARAAATAPAN
jgi:hypothetical protein